MTHKAVETYLHIVIPDKVVVGVNNNVTANHENASQHAHSNTSSRGWRSSIWRLLVGVIGTLYSSNTVGIGPCKMIRLVRVVWRARSSYRRVLVVAKQRGRKWNTSYTCYTNRWDTAH